MSAELKQTLSPVAKTDFNSPFDTLIGAPHLDWLRPLDDILRQRDDKEDDRLLFGQFVQENPQVEHFGGVSRGGTFVLAYDEGGTVVGDFMLPFHCPEPAREVPEPMPAVRPPGLRPPLVVTEGVQIGPTRTATIQRQLAQFGPTITATFDAKLQQQAGVTDAYVKAVKDSVQVVRAETRPTGGLGIGGDPVLKGMVDEFQSDVFKQQARQALLADPTLPADRKTAIQAEVSSTDTKLVDSTKLITDYVSATKLDVGAGSDGFLAISTVSAGKTAISDTTKQAAVDTHFDEVATRTQNVGLKTVITSVVRR